MFYEIKGYGLIINMKLQNFYKSKTSSKYTSSVQFFICKMGITIAGIQRVIIIKTKGLESSAYLADRKHYINLPYTDSYL